MVVMVMVVVVVMVVMVMMMLVELGRNQARPCSRAREVIDPKLLQRIWYGVQKLGIELVLQLIRGALRHDRCSLRGAK
jgi:hypothetical protein